MCEIENVPSLELIEMGELNEGSNIFHDCCRAVFESESAGKRMMNRLA